MDNIFQFDPVELPPECKELRKEVRAFLKQEIEAGTFSPGGGRNENAELFAKKVGAKGKRTGPPPPPPTRTVLGGGGSGGPPAPPPATTRLPTGNRARCCCAMA